MYLQSDQSGTKVATPQIDAAPHSVETLTTSTDRCWAVVLELAAPGNRRVPSSRRSQYNAICCLKTLRMVALHSGTSDAPSLLLLLR